MKTTNINGSGSSKLKPKRRGSNEYGIERRVPAGTQEEGKLTVRLITHSSRCAQSNLSTAVLDQVRDGWEFVIDPSVMTFLLSSAVQRLYCIAV